MEKGWAGSTKKSIAKAEKQKCELEVGARCVAVSRKINVIKHQNLHKPNKRKPAPK